MIEVYDELQNQMTNYANILSFLKHEITNTTKIHSFNFLRNSFKRISQLFIILDNRIPELKISAVNNKRKLNSKRSFNHYQINKCQTDLNFKHIKPKVETRKLAVKTPRKLPTTLMKLQEQLNINHSSDNPTKNTIAPPRLARAYLSVINIQNCDKVRNISKIIYPIFNSYELLICHKDADRIRKQDKQILIIENIFNHGNLSAKTIGLAMEKIWRIEHELTIITKSLNLFQEIQLKNHGLTDLIDCIGLSNNSIGNSSSNISRHLKYQILCTLGSSIKHIRNHQTHISKYVILLNEKRNTDRILLYLRRRDTLKNLMKIIEMERRNIRKDIVIICQSQLRE